MNTPSKRRGVAALAVGVLVTVPAAIALQTSATGTTAAPQTITFKQRAGTFRYVDLPPRGTPAPSPGDMFLITNKLYKAGERIGTLQARCVVMRRGNAPWLCDGAYRLRNGIISGTAVIFEDNTRNRIAVTGGTGAYAGATGVSVETFVNENLATVKIRLQ
jgi:hypothetical protein